MRPPLVGTEARSQRASAWRFRLVLLLALIGVAAIAVAIVAAVVPSAGLDPGVGAQAPRASSASR